MTSLQIGLASLSITFALYVLYTDRALSDFPGPFIARYTNWWKVYHMYKGDYEQVLREWHERHGSLIRIGPNNLSVAEPREVSKIYGLNPLFHKGNMYKPLIGWFKGKNVAGIESILDEREHATVRKIVSPAFSPAAVSTYESRIDRCANELVERVAELGIFDITKWMKWWSIDSINMIAFSSTPGFMKRSEDIDRTLQIVQSMLSMMVFTYPIATTFMWFAWAMSYIGHLIIPILPFVELGVKHVNVRLTDREKSRTDILDTYMVARHKHPANFTFERLVGMTISIVLAGADTTAIISTWTLYSLMRDAIVTTKLREEIEDAMGQGMLSYPPSLKELSNLPFLNATVKEGLRYTAMIKVGLERVVPPGGIEICGQFVPGGTAVGCHQSIVHMDRGIYGEDAGEFNPSRWIDCSEEERKLMERCGLWFGQGKHLCIGQHIAKAEMLKIFAMMFMKLELCPQDKGAIMVSKSTNLFRFSSVPYYVQVKRKSSSSGQTSPGVKLKQTQQ